MLVDARGGSINDLLVAKNDMRDAELQASTAPIDHHQLQSFEAGLK